MKQILKNKGMILFILFMVSMAWVNSVALKEIETQKNVVVTRNDCVIQRTNK